MSLHSHFTIWHQKVTFCLTNQVQNASCSFFCSAAHVQAMAVKVSLLFSRFPLHHYICALWSINWNDSLDHLLPSAGSHHSVVLSPWVSLSYPSSSGHTTQILIPAFVSSAGSRQHWCYPESFWQTVTNSMWSSSALAEPSNSFFFFCNMILEKD